MSKQLTLEQKKIVTHVDGHSLIKAVPGSGKTTTLIMRVAYLIRCGVNPNNILILMFNKAAQLSFKEKLEIKLKKDGIIDVPEVRTFHSFARQLVKHAESGKYIKKKKFLDTSSYEYKKIIKKCSAQDGYVDNNEIEALELKISNWRLEEVTAADLFNDPTYKKIPVESKKAYCKYLKLLDELGFRTFDEMIIESVSLMKNHSSFTPSFQHVIVDEYQDVNYIQNEFVKCLAREHTSVMAVGDVNQCIYEWRGSKSDFIQGIFQNHFLGTTIYHLSNTFRFGKSLSHAANTVIYKNKEPDTNKCVSHDGNPNTKVEIHHGIEFLSLLGSHFDDFRIGTTAVIGRAHSDLLEPELILQLKNIPYRNISSKKTLILRPELSLLAVLFCIGVDGELSKLKSFYDLKKVIRSFVMQLSVRLEKGIQTKIVDLISNNTNSFWLVLDKYVSSQNNNNLKILNALKNISGKLNSDFSACELFKIIKEQGLLNNVSENSILRLESNDQQRGISRIENLLNTLDITCDVFLHVLISPPIYAPNTDYFELLTMHGSKGLEWDNVIIVGLHDKVFPGQDISTQDSKSPDSNPQLIADSLKEERRLFYVAITRAIKQLHLLVPNDSSLIYWQSKGWFSTPKKPVIATRFVFEMNLTSQK